MDPKIRTGDVGPADAAAYDPVFDGTVAPPLAQNNVLRNTYWLLALSMLPTIAGAFVGMQLNFFAQFAAHPDRDAAADVRRDDGLLFVVTRLRNSGWGVVALFGFTFVAGLMLTPILTVAAGFRNGWQLVGLAGGMTAAIFFAMAAIATVTQARFHRSWASSCWSARSC